MANHADQINQHKHGQPFKTVQQGFEKEQENQNSFDKEEERLGDPSTFKKYDGNCHCGKFRFKITLPELRKLNECNCSICFVNGLRGLVWFPLGGKRKFEIVEGDEEKDLTSYSFGSGRLQHKFCNECGTNLFAREGNEIGVNALALEPMEEIENIPLSSRSEHKKVAEPQYQTQHGEAVKWPTDETPKEGEIEYQGHCHCGSVRYVLRQKPLKEWTVNDCNCSICFKSGINTTFISSNSIHYAPGARESCTAYPLQQKSTPLLFCKVCGTHVCVKGPHDETVAVINARTLENPEKPGEMLDHNLLKKRELGGAQMRFCDMRQKEPKYTGRRHEIKEDTTNSARRCL